MKKIKALLLASMGFSLFIALLIDSPLEAACCMAARKPGCFGDGIYRNISSGAGVTTASCKVDAMDYYGMAFSCINLYLDTTSIGCY
jgi:hypothetical protein